MIPIDGSSMNSERDVGADVRWLIRTKATPGLRAGDLPDDLSLGSSGLGLDSIALVELLLACEEHFALPFPAGLLDRGPLTIGHLIEHVRSERRRSV
jgi:acyl carrier protein